MGLTRPRAYQIYDIDYKQAVRVITVSNVSLSGGAPSQVDGVNLSTGDRILVTGQSTGSLNGIYQVSTVGTGSDGTWIRSTDTNTTGELLSGTIVMVTEGVTYADTSWKLTTNDPITIGVTALVWELNTGDSWGIISANGTSVFADSASDTVTFTPGNNIVIIGNATSDTITFEVSQNPNFTGTLDVKDVSITGNITGNLIPAANVTYNLGSPTQRWKEIFLAGNTIDIGGALISADLATGSLILTGPDGAEFVLTGSSPTTSVGQFGMIQISNSMSSHNTTTGALTVVGGAGIGGNINVGGIIDVVGNSIYLGNLLLKDNGSNIFGLYAADGITPATISQSSVDTTRISNGTSNVQVVSSNANVTVAVDGISNVGVFYSGGLAITGDLSVTGNATLSGNIIGDRIVNGTTNIEIQTTSGNANISVSGISNVAVFNSAGLDITGNVAVSGQINAIGNINSGNLTTSGIANVGTLAVIGNANVSGTSNITGNITGGNLFTTGALSVTGISSMIGGAKTNSITSASTSITLYDNTQLSISIGGADTLANVKGKLNVVGNANVGNLGSTGLITSTGNIEGDNLIARAQVEAIGNIIGANINTAGQVVSTGNVSGAVIKSSANIEIQNRGILFLNDSDNSNYVGLRSPASLTGNYIYIFPSSYGNADQVLATNGSGGLSWVDQSGGGGGGGATSYPNSTVQPVPGSTGNFDLSYNFVQTVQESAFESSATDPFGVNLGEVYSMMDPVGEVLEGVDLGVLT